MPSAYPLTRTAAPLPRWFRTFCCVDGYAASRRARADLIAGRKPKTRGNSGGTRERLPPTDVDALSPVVEEVQRLHAYRDGQRVPVVDGWVGGEPDGQLGRAPVVPARVGEDALVAPAVRTGLGVVPVAGTHPDADQFAVLLPVGHPADHVREAAQPAALGDVRRGTPDVVDGHRVGTDVQVGQRLVAVVLQVTDAPAQ